MILLEADWLVRSKSSIIFTVREELHCERSLMKYLLQIIENDVIDCSSFQKLDW